MNMNTVAGTFSKKLTLLVLTLFVVDYYSGYNALAYYQNIEQFISRASIDKIISWGGGGSLATILSLIALKLFVYFMIARLLFFFFIMATTVIYYLAAILPMFLIVITVSIEVDAMYQFWGSFLLLSIIGASAWYVALPKAKNTAYASNQQVVSSQSEKLPRPSQHYLDNRNNESELIPGLSAFNYEQMIEEQKK